jgi:CRISPR-associated protein Csn2
MSWNLNFGMLDEPIKIANLTSFTIESKALFARLAQNLHNYEPGESDLKLFDNNYNSLKPDELIVVSDILTHEINTPTILKHVYKDIEQQISANPETKVKIEDAINMVFNLINKELIHFELDLECETMNLQTVFKALTIRIHQEDSTLFERTLSILQAFKYLTRKKLLVLINLGAFLTQSEIESLAEFVSLQNVTVLMLDNTPIKATINQVILDEDYVVMRKNVV